MSPVDALLVVGGGPAGHAAALAFRAAGGTGPVRILSADEDPPYNRPPLSKDYLRGETGEDELPLSAEDGGPDTELDPDTDPDITVEVGESVIALDPAARTVDLASGRTLSYRTLVLAVGMEPVTLPVPGGDHPAVHTLRFLAQARALRGSAEDARTAVVVGSGFIGCEAAVSLARRGVSVTMVSPQDTPQEKRLGAEVGRRLAGWLDDEGVRLLGGRSVERIEDGRTVVLTDGSTLTADLVLAAVGVRPVTGFVQDAGVAVQEGRIVVDEHMRTSFPGIWAAGDAVLARNAAAGRHLAVEHWGEALAMGEVAGRQAAGDGTAAWSAVPGFWSEIGDRTLKYAAWGDGFDDVTVVDHAGGEPGAFTAWYARDGVLVGVLAHGADEDYERGGELVGEGAPARD
ncbi:FAD-dependent oxidoreductase [Nakamurella flavida]|uniref:FAD-dependent oxidoreductase n=1 Tax=Nakamurella flavida TaxID=363630 RepID=A0A938YPQ7_9ACTN|nr:FAD-dependent oxidoreductase [Nakamurella flavida]MBM9477222.1 FAD-dependent oxidoreductase [Nakamurella flavida]MDP9780171.1 NADPH-dependent 2,4-dienoyl-CoA reductase/sulfur reductase-like enzyme [Nakamurella flavida]